MPTISNLSFNVRFNLTGAPSLVLTDTTTSPPVGFVGIFEITQPDGYVRSGDINSPDIVGGGSFSFTLRLDGSGGVQCGTYTIKLTGNAPGYLSTDFTRTFVFSYSPVSLAITPQFDIFTPDLSCTDSTSYQVGGYTAGSVTRAWSVTSTPTGTITGSAATIDLIYNGHYYDAAYTISLTSSLTYTHQTYSWLTISEGITSTITADACTPLNMDSLVSHVEALRDANCSGEIPEFEKAQSLLSHLIDMISVNFTTGSYTNDVFSVYESLRAMFNITCVHTNQPIPVYELTFLVGPWYGYTIDGGTADSIYLPSQIINGGNA